MNVPTGYILVIPVYLLYKCMYLCQYTYKIYTVPMYDDYYSVYVHYIMYTCMQHVHACQLYTIVCLYACDGLVVRQCNDGLHNAWSSWSCRT